MDKIKKFSILYVEDDLDTREELTAFLEQKCTVLHIACDGKEGLELFKKYLPNLVISDIQMPNMNGIAMAKEIKKININIPIVFITAFNEISYLKASMDLGITNYIEKPVNLSLLGEKIDEIFYPQKAFIATCIIDSDMIILNTNGCWQKIFNKSPISEKITNYIMPSYANTLFASVSKLRKDESFYREKIVIQNEQKTIELLASGKKISDDKYEITLTMMNYFINSYEMVQQILNKERTLKRILEYKNLIHVHMTKSKTVQDFYDLICRYTVNHQKYPLSLIYELTNGYDFILSAYYANSRIDTQNIVSGFSIDDQNSEFWQILCTNKAQIINHNEFQNCPFLGNLNLEVLPKFLILMPIFLDKNSKPMGFFTILNDKDFLYDIEELDMFSDIGLTIALGVDRIKDKQKLINLLNKAEHQSRIDTLTNIHNRLMFTEMIEKFIVQSIQTDSPLCLVYIDLDRFKDVNDTYGHEKGDKVLVKFAKVVSKSIRNSDFFARIGGEEFALLLPYTDLNEAISVIKKIQLDMGKVNFLPNNQSITISAGIAQYNTKNKERSVTLIGKADKKLYEAKNSGRDTICY